jgi:uncharacterized protein (TIGR02246 family)
MNRIANSFVVAVFLALLLVSCQAPQTNVADVRNAIEAADANQMSAFVSKDIAGMTANYAPDAVILPQNGPAVSGKENIEASFKEMSSTMSDLKLTISTVNASGDLAYEVGNYTATIQMPGMAPTADKGKFVTVWKRQADGKWMIVADIFNTDLPPAMPSTEQKKK